MRATSAAGGAAPPVAAAAVAALRGTAPGADCWSCCTFKLCCGHGAVAVCILLVCTTSAVGAGMLLQLCRQPCCLLADRCRASRLHACLVAGGRRTGGPLSGGFMSQQITDAIGQLDLMISSAAAPGNGAMAAAAPAAAAPPAVATVAGGSMRQQLAAAFQTAIDAAFPAMAGEPAIVVACNQPKFGDYQCNNAMALHGKMKGKVSHALVVGWAKASRSCSRAFGLAGWALQGSQGLCASCRSCASLICTSICLQPDAPKAPRMVAEAILAQLPDTGMVAETSLAGGRFGRGQP